MADTASALMVVAALSAPPELAPSQNIIPKPYRSWCTPGYTVMIPDGREGFVSSVDGNICRVITDGEAFVTPLPDYIVEPVYPQKFAARSYR